jgi:hypothetical protein
MLIMSCGSTSKAVYQTKEADSKIRFYISDNPNYRKGEGKFYARVDSGNVRIFYSFQEGNIYKTYDNVANYVYTLVFDKNPMLPLTSLDTNVLYTGNKLLDSLDYKHLKRPNGARGFVAEVARH